MIGRGLSHTTNDRTEHCRFASTAGSVCARGRSSHRLLAGAHNRHHRAALPARPIKLTIEDVLPAREAEPAVDDRDGLARSDQAGLEMAVCVAVLPVVFPYPARGELAQHGDYITLNTVVPVFLDHDRRGCALGVDAAEAGPHPALGDDRGHAVGDVVERFAGVGREGDGLLHGGMVGLRDCFMQLGSSVRRMEVGSQA